MVLKTEEKMFVFEKQRKTGPERGQNQPKNRKKGRNRRENAQTQQQKNSAGGAKRAANTDQVINDF
jgi:hypothetical protein